MKIPVCGQPYEVVAVPVSSDMSDKEDIEALGSTDIWKRRIELNLQEIQKEGQDGESVVLHELIHAVLAESGWGLWLKEKDKDVEEGIVTAMETGLFPHVTLRDGRLRALSRKKVKR